MLISNHGNTMVDINNGLFLCFLRNVMAIALVATHNDTSITLTQVDRYLDDLRCIYISSHHNRVVSDKPQTIGTTKIYVFLGAATSS